jgi:hypothetical protein
LELVLGVSQQLGNDALFGFAACTIKHVPVLSDPDAKTLNVIWQARDGLRLLRKFEGSCCKGLLDGCVWTSFRVVKEQISLGSELFGGSHRGAPSSGERRSQSRTVASDATSLWSEKVDRDRAQILGIVARYRTITPCRCPNSATSAW